MITVNPIELVISFGGGLLLSGAYFAALWITVRRLPHARAPYALLGASFLLRTVGLLAGFYVLMQGRWERLLACVAGYLLVRTICVARMKIALLRTSSAQGGA